ncbi:uncharacterized protein J4E79_004730 [Alternaria viburni]|uniref:uncharacterized protein n=1 Tax=Alternaria viburni TaxID=566460 RepID=UPI0020C314DB|nr:uncharacterized protein J4E79_004730 [Alternaria viburni]KAI4662440.1 hypothetical protein J4E79_004730 [Alternaria viburni]
MLPTSIFAASSFIAFGTAFPLYSRVATSTTLAPRAAYTTFGGDGSTAAGWPRQSEWKSFEDAWASNQDTIRGSCENHGWGDNNSDAETQAIKDSIESESVASGVPKELILAIMMQESKGCVRAPTTASDAPNPGLMQGAGTASCHTISPCPANVIHDMIHEGTTGEGLRLSLKKALDAFSATPDDSKYYKAARLYNSGDQVTDPNLGQGATACYASDIANRLIEPFGDSSCDNGAVASLTQTAGRETVNNDNNNNNDDQQLDLEQHQTVDEQPAPKQNADTQTADSGVLDTTITGAVDGCIKYYTPSDGSTCEAAPVPLAVLRQLNPQLSEDCSNLWAGYGYCIATLALLSPN